MSVPANTRPTTPSLQPLTGITQTRFSLFRFRSPLLTESQLFSLPVGTEMFHFPTFPPHALYIQARVTPHDGCWVSPFGHPRITVWLSTPRGLSQIPTSFIGSWCQGIHHVLLKTWPQQNKDARVHYTILKQHTRKHTPPTKAAHAPSGPNNVPTPTPDTNPQRSNPQPRRRTCHKPAPNTSTMIDDLSTPALTPDNRT
jgi:hypothetical protein